ncbi:MAG: signal peptide peptidase SppA [Candidatus Muirbacterium halophilum]|nr:signal peptide peptidase SppA [Candidatus Muirbacterium halophilum]MCK9474739.1 signal peptide peptidase SppA [Candidatus Muirbacterium halophilum]
MKKLIVWLMIAGLITGFIGFFIKSKDIAQNESILMNPVRKTFSSDSIGVIELNGVISYDSQGYFERTSTAGSLIRDFKYFTSTNVKAVVLRINSPGGSIGAVQEVCYAMQKYRDNGGKIVASFKDISASGGYYISCFADSIIANPGTLTGSIGVIMSMPNVSELFEKLGIKYNTVKSGKFKDIGNLSREMSEEEFALLQTTVDDSYEQFVDAVSKGRNLSVEEVKKIADGRIFTGRQAKEIGLVDELGGFDIAFEKAKTLANIKGKGNIVYANTKKTLLDYVNELN